MNGITITYATLTDQGGRPVNEDYLGVTTIENGYLFALCDGLGGHGNGDVASHLVIDSVLGTMKERKTLEEGIMIAQNRLIHKQMELNAENTMKTTVVCLEVRNDVFRFVHVGDSRVYYFEKHKMKIRSMDHSVPQMLANRGAIKEKDIRFHEDRSRLLRVMGTRWDGPKYQASEWMRLSGKSSFLLCSDGFWELIDEKNMGAALKVSASPQEWLSRMRPVVLANGAGKNMDNYSAIAVFCR